MNAVSRFYRSTLFSFIPPQPTVFKTLGLSSISSDKLSFAKLDSYLSSNKLSSNKGVNKYLLVSALFGSLVLGTPCMYSMAHAGYDLPMSLQIGKVTVTDTGEEQFIPVTTANTGEVVQYRATYKNPRATPIEDVFVTLPIPYQMVFTGEAYPASAQGSIDSINYADMPLLRQQEEGLVEIPFAQYRSLRWHIKHLPAHRSATVSLNAVVEDMPH